MTIPFTYLIGWKKQDKYYYGVRYADGCDPNDLWNTYYTSSKHVKDFRKQYGDPDIVEVRRTFPNRHESLLWEEKVLKRLKVREDDRWLNKNDQCAPPVMKGKDHPLFGIGHSEEAKRKVSEKNKGKLKGIPKSEEHRRKISEARKKNWATNDALRKKLSDFAKGNDHGKMHKGWKPSEETRQRMSESAKTRKIVNVTCEVCGLEMGPNNINQHMRARHK